MALEVVRLKNDDDDPCSRDLDMARRVRTRRRCYRGRKQKCTTLHTHPRRIIEGIIVRPCKTFLRDLFVFVGGE